MMDKNSDNNIEPSLRPFLKWEGERYRVIKKISEILPKGNRLIETSVGAGSVFLNTSYNKLLLSDTNSDLINTFTYLKHEKENFIIFCRQFFTDEFNNKKAYISLRKEFNSTSDSRLKAALFIYLNRHGYNGLSRYNRSGVFNTPFGSYFAPYFPKSEMLGFIKKTRNASFQCAEYDDVIKKAVIGDVVYCDSTYLAYISLKEQKKLIDLIEEISAKGIPIILSNYDGNSIFQDLCDRARLVKIECQRNINCRQTSRGQICQVIAIFNKEAIK